MSDSIEKLKNIHSRDDIWILCSGPSLNFVDSSFFENKITIGVNRVGKFFPCKYTVTKDARGVEKLREKSDSIIILSEYDCGNTQRSKNKRYEGAYYFPHKHNIGPPTIESIGTDEIVVSASTVTSAIHIAAYMGAKNIILCGHDCGFIDGNLSIEGYHEDLPPLQDKKQYERFITNDIELQTEKTVRALKKHYGCNIHSLNPFLNLGIRGHKYSKSRK